MTRSLRIVRSLRRRSRDDDGLTLIFVALALVVMMLFMALAIDLGQVYSERRLDQNSADASATSGAVQFLSVQSAQAAADEILSKADADLGRTVTAAEWNACSDANHLAYTATTLGLTPETECISFSVGFGRLRVKLPEQTITASFSRVIGIESFTSNAFAEVTMLPASGGALPFVVLHGSGAGDQICLRTDGTGGSEPPDQPAIPPYQDERELDPCNEQSFATSDGGRGTLLPYLYNGCNKPTGNQSIVDSIMQGMDHALGTFDPEAVLGPGDDANVLDSDARARIDGDGGCTTVLPNSVEVDTGFTAHLLRCALLETPCNSGTSATYNEPGRLTASTAASFTGLGVRDVALWDYFVPSLPSQAPNSCAVAKSSGTEFYMRRAALIDCLQEWNSGQLFRDDIGDEARLGFVPKVAESGLCRIQPDPVGSGCSGAAPKHIHVNGFAPVYIDGLYLDQGGTCDTTNPATPTFASKGWAIHYPGNGLQCAPNGSQVGRISGIVLPCGALPSSVCDPSRNPPFPDTLGISAIRLAR